MSIAEVTPSIEAVSYTSIDWEAFKSIEGHPLEFLLNQGIPVYYKIHRGVHFAFRYQWRPLLRRLPETASSLAAKLPDYSFMGGDEQLVLLQLDDDDLCEILATGNRGSTEFSLGGLGLPKAQTDDNGRIEIGLVDIDFHRCYLIDRRRWKYAQQTAASISPPRPDDYAEPVWIGYEDLYLQSDDVAALKGLKNGVGVERQPYPFATRERKLPAPINWLYQAAYALNRDREIGRNEEKIKSWLRTNSPDRIFKKRWVRTAPSLIPLDYKFGARFDEARLAEFRMGEALRSPYISIPLTFALAIAEWWMDQQNADFRSKRIELAGQLEDVGFQKIAVYDLTGMISGEAVKDEDQEEFDGLLDRWQKGKSLALVRRLGEHGIGHAELEGSAATERASSGSGAPANGDSEKVPPGKSYVPRNFASRI